MPATATPEPTATPSPAPTPAPLVVQARDIDLGDLNLPDPGLRPSTFRPPAAPTPVPQPTLRAIPTATSAPTAVPIPTAAVAPVATAVPARREVTVRPPLSEMVEKPVATDVTDAARTAIGRAAARRALQQRLDAIADMAKQGHPERARAEYLDLAKAFARSEVAPEALYRAAELIGDDPKQELAEHYSIVELHPASPWARKSLLAIGHLHAVQGDWARSLDAYTAYESVSKEPLGRQAELDTIRALVETGAVDRALPRLADFQKQYPDAADGPDVLALKSNCLVAMGKYPEATQTLREFVRRYPRHPSTPGALLSLGLCFEELGRIDDARRAYGLLLEFFPPGGADAPPERALAQASLERLSRPLFK